ncbi:uncharacterized protein RAG0_07218 [Rhynchosporium agropyri]|uniref:Uncharacterized protein n=1 Tax=Rhynchosporium agropyri TaxID=914238 RepID=A0A1E1KKE9_9HELO|nr:uncharacterized protein RAG0_07218 [Rhynchosporium agropyri]
MDYLKESLKVCGWIERTTPDSKATPVLRKRALALMAMAEKFQAEKSAKEASRSLDMADVESGDVKMERSASPSNSAAGI